MDLSIVETAGFSAALAAITVISLAFAIYSHLKNRSHQALGYALRSKPIFDATKMTGLLNSDISVEEIPVTRLY